MACQGQQSLRSNSSLLVRVFYNRLNKRERICPDFERKNDADGSHQTSTNDMSFPPIHEKIQGLISSLHAGNFQEMVLQVDPHKGRSLQ